MGVVDSPPDLNPEPNQTLTLKPSLNRQKNLFTLLGTGKFLTLLVELIFLYSSSKKVQEHTCMPSYTDTHIYATLCKQHV